MKTTKSTLLPWTPGVCWMVCAAVFATSVADVRGQDSNRSVVDGRPVDNAPTTDNDPAADDDATPDNGLVGEGDFATRIESNRQPLSTTSATENPARWRYHASLALPPRDVAVTEDGPAPLTDVILGREVFSHARLDLADIRIFSESGQPHPYALRYRRPQSVREQVRATEFNRLELEDGVKELTLELTPRVVQHNELQIVTSGNEFRRAVEVDGSDDGRQWRRLVEGFLLRFAKGDQKIDVDSLKYADSRFRFVRFRVHPDPSPTVAQESDGMFEIRDSAVLRTVDLPGERTTWQAIVGLREPTRIDNAPGSSWIVDLRGQNIPCDRLEVEVADAEFAREIQLQVEQPSPRLGQLTFQTLYISDGSTWQRKSGEPEQPMVVRFPEMQASRLRLLVTDYQNAPLEIRSATVSADARQVVFARPKGEGSELRLFVGNPLAGAPNYDFARNLPERLDPPPHRIELKPVVANADFVPPPQPFTERFPWLIYVVLSAVCVLLLAIIASLARKAVAMHDADSRMPA